ncbi:hypothetical protein ACYSNW_05855 [Enterococcus sp. LJL99]
MIDNKGLSEEKISKKYLANTSLTVIHSQLSEYTQVTLDELYKEPNLYLNKKITLLFLNSGLTTKMNDAYISVINDLNRNSYLNLNVKDNTIVSQSKLDKNGWIYVSGTFTNYSLTNTIGTFKVYMDNIIEISLERP